MTSAVRIPVGIRFEASEGSGVDFTIRVDYAELTATVAPGGEVLFDFKPIDDGQPGEANVNVPPGAG